MRSERIFRALAERRRARVRVAALFYMYQRADTASRTGSIPTTISATQFGTPAQKEKFSQILLAVPNGKFFPNRPKLQVLALIVAGKKIGEADGHGPDGKCRFPSSPSLQ